MVPNFAGEGAFLHLVAVLCGDAELLVQLLADVLDIDAGWSYHNL